MSVRTGVVIHEYTYRKLLAGVLLLLHELYSKNSSSQAWKLGDIKSPSQQNHGGRSFLSYTSGHEYMSYRRSRTSCHTCTGDCLIPCGSRDYALRARYVHVFYYRAYHYVMS